MTYSDALHYTQTTSAAMSRKENHMALTERQQEIKDLLEQGQKADEIGKKLGITTNAVYQQIRRMRGAKGKRATAKRGRQSAAKPATTPKPAPVLESRPTTPLQAVRNRRDEIKATVGTLNSEVEAARRALAAAEAVAAKAATRHKEELKALDKAEAALRPQRSAPAAAKPAPKKRARRAAPKAAPASGNGSQGAQEGAGDAEAGKVPAAA